MAVGLDATLANSWLDGLCSSTTWSEPAGFYLKLHTADPTAGGDTAAFGDTTRQTATFGAASLGAIANSAAFNWTNLSAGGTISHLSFWSASSGGTFLGSCALTASKTVSSGDNFSIAIGDLDLTITPIAAD